MKSLWFYIVVAISLALLPSCKEEKSEYVPIKAFEPSFQALTGAKSGEHDIEATVRVLNGLELAQARSESFDEFLEFMAKQDYSNVAQDVVDLRVKLLPVLQEMYLIDQELEHVNMWNTLGRDLSTDVSQLAETNIDKSKKSQLRGLLRLLPISNTIEPISIAVSTVSKTGERIFNKFEESQKLEDDLRGRLHKVRQRYLEYLQEYMPVYKRHMKEWDRLCLVKDRVYLQLYSGQYREAFESSREALKIDPNNREMLLLQSMAIVQDVAYPNQIKSLKDQSVTISANTTLDENAVSRLQNADKMLDGYIQKHPAYSAPALLLKGIIYSKMGNKSKALTYFDQAATEYPRQADHLTDMLSSYRARTYLNQTAEGAYLLNLYQSTMEGFGIFSPNFAKAALHEQSGDMAMAREEIYNHFFRRSNQAVHDCLLSDMKFCEENLSFSFKQLLPENSYMDVEFARSAKFMGMGSDNNRLTISLHNRSDKPLENVRLFLCIHFTDMYKTDYHVVRIPTRNRINANQRIEFGEVELKYKDKTFEDITRVRAIALTDNSLCWIDNVYNADAKINYNPTRTATVAELTNSLNTVQRERYFKLMNEDTKSISESLRANTTIEVKEGGNIFKRTNVLHIRLPRIVVMLNPAYKLNEQRVPSRDVLQDSAAHLVFDDVVLNESNTLTIKSIYASYAIYFTKSSDNKYNVTKVDLLTL